MAAGGPSAGAKVWRNARLATLGVHDTHLGMVETGAVAVDSGRIVYAGPEAGLPAAFAAADGEDCGGRLITPGLVDCHTHLVYAGNRANEFEMRLDGATYEAIARAGGGIVSSVRALRQASEAELVAQSLPRLDALIAEGATTVEIKSGYGLDLDNELKALRAARQLATLRPVTIRTSFLGAHALPPEAAADRAGHVKKLAGEMVPAAAAAGLADAVDGFCETIAFTPAEIAAVFVAAQALGLPVKLHADQLSDLGGAALAARFGALSADHLEYANEDGVAAMAAAGTVAVLLPGAFYFCARPKSRRWRCSGGTVCRWRSRPTAIRALRRSPRCC